MIGPSKVAYEDGEASHDDLRAMLAHSSAANGWDESGMEGYDRYDEEYGRLLGSGVDSCPNPRFP